LIDHDDIGHVWCIRGPVTFADARRRQLAASGAMTRGAVNELPAFPRLAGIQEDHQAADKHNFVVSKNRE
jgi:hypothetical protein